MFPNRFLHSTNEARPLVILTNINPCKERVKRYKLWSCQNVCEALRGRVSNNFDNPQFLLEKELSFLHLLKS